MRLSTVARPSARLSALLPLAAAAAAQAPVPGDYLFQPVGSGHDVLVIDVAYSDAPTTFYPHDVEQHRQEVETLIEQNARLGPEEVTTTHVRVVLPQPYAYYAHAQPPARQVVLLRADAVAAAGVTVPNPEGFDRILVLSPQQAWAGDRAIGFARTGFVSGTHPFPSGWLWGHELGHTYGWGHANFWSVPVSAHPPLYPRHPEGTSVEYGDPFCPMGDGGPRSFRYFHPWRAYRAGWLSAADVPVVTASGTYAVNALEAPPGAGGRPSALRIRHSPVEECWILLRETEEAVANGVVLTVVERRQAPTLLLDMTPGSGGGTDDCELVVDAEPYLYPDPEPDPDGVGYTVRLLSIVQAGGNACANVRVDFHAGATQPPIDELPVVDVTAPSYGETLQAPIVFAATAYDPDAVPPGCPPQDGMGIDRVEFTFGAVGDGQFQPLAEPVEDGQEPFYGEAYPAGTGDRPYAIRVRAFADDGGVAEIHAEFVQDFPGQ